MLQRPPAEAVVAEFSVLEELAALDLSELPVMPSIFDSDNRHEREGLLFLEYFVREIARPVRKDGREHVEYVPESLQGNDDAMAFYGVIHPYFDGEDKQVDQLDRIASEAALAINTIIHRHSKVHFWDDADAQKRAMNDIDDYLYDEVRGAHGFELGVDQMDEIIEKSMQLARHRTPA